MHSINAKIYPSINPRTKNRMATPIYVTATTTLVQVDTTIVGGVTQDYVVILPSINAPGALITIRDIAGYASLTNRIVVTVAAGISFLGTTQTSISITQPYGTITVTPRSISVWAILNTFAFPEASQNANMSNITTQNLTAKQSYLDNAIVSTALISTLSTDNVFIRANLSVGQSTIAHAGFYVCSLRTLEDMLVGGVLYAGSTVSSIFANVTSTLTVPYISTQNIEIYGVLRSASTISTMGPIFAGSSISTTGNLAVGGSTFVQGELKVLQNVIFQSSLSTLYSLGVGREAMFYSSLTVKDNILTNGHLSTMSNVNVGGALSVMKSAFFTGQISTQSNLTVGGALSVMSTFYTYGDAVLNSSLYVRSGVSTLSNVYIASSLSVGGDLAVYGDLFFNDRLLDLKNLSVTQDLFVNNNISTYSSITAGLGLRIMGSTFLMGPVSTLSNMNIGGGLSTMKDLAVTGAAYIQSNLVIQSTLSTMGHMNLTGFLSTLSSGSIGHNLEVGRDLMVKSSLNVLGSTMLQSSVFITGSLSVFSSIAVDCNLDVGNLLRVRALNTDVLRVSTLGVVRTDGFVLNVSSSTLHFGLFSTFGSMDIGGRVSTTRELVVGSTIDTQFINVRKNLSTTGDAYIGSNLFVLSSIQSGASTIVNGGLYVGNDVVLAEAVRMKTLLVTQTAVITGVTSINNNANILRTLTVRGGVTITNESGQQSQNLISNDTYMSSLKVSSIINYNFQSTLGQAAFYSSMQIQGHLSVFSTLAAACNADVGALLTASSIATRALQVSTLNIVQQTDFTLNVSSSTLHHGLFSTSGAIFSGAPISTMASLAAGDNVNFYRNLTVGGNTVTDGIFQVRGAATLSNILNVGQAATLSNTLAVGSATTLSNTLNVGSVTTLSNTLRVAEATTLSNTLAVGSATTLSDTLRVGLATTLSNTLDVGSVTTLSNTLRVGNATTLSNTLNVIGATTLPGGLTVTGNIKTAGTNAVAFGNGAGITSQGQDGVAIGSAAGATSQGNYGIAVGSEAGKVSQLSKAIAIGQYAGSNNQKIAAVAIGAEAGRITQGEAAVALGVLAGNTNQANTAIAIGAVSGNENQSESAIAIGASAGYSAQGLVAVAIGSLAGGYSQGQNSIAIGASAGNLNQGLSAVAIGNTAASSGQGEVAVAIGARAGFTTQGYAGVAIGNQAGSNNQGLYSLAIGHQAGTTSQGDGAVALGLFAGKTSQAASAIAIGQSAGITSQKINAIAIGCNAGTINQGQNSIAIGASAGAVTQVANSIILNASGADLNAATTGLFVNPIRNTAATSYLKYNTTTSEISYIADSNLTVGSFRRFIVAGHPPGTIVVTSNYGTTYVNGSQNIVTGLNVIKTNGKVILAAGSSSSGLPIVYSYDGLTWTRATGSSLTLVRQIIWTGTQFIAFGNGVSRSPDGITWTNITLPTSTLNVCSSADFNGYYYLISSTANPSVLYKYDPAAATIIEVPTAFSLINKIFWTGSFWLIGGAGTYKLVSYNGGNTVTQLTYANDTVRGIASDGKRFVAVGGVTVCSSSDGVTWTTGSNPFSPSTYISDVIWDGTNFVAFFWGGSKLARSVDGVSWSGASSSTDDFVTGVAFTYSAVQTLANNGLLATDSISTTGFVTIGDSLRVGQSTLVVQDSTRSMGVNCNSPSYPIDVNGIINAKFIYQNGAPYQPPPTTGAVTIINLTVSTVTAGTSMSVANTTVPNRILILGQATSPLTEYRLYTGTTATNMTINNTALTGSPIALNAAYYTGTSWFMGGQAASSAVLYSSPDSAAWTLITPAGAFPNSAVNAIVYNGLYYLVCGTDTSVAAGIAESRSIVKSDNMTSFTASSSTAGSFAFKSGAYAAAWNGTLWVALGADSTSGTIQNPTVTIKYSYDGINWTAATNSFTASSASKGYTVVWNGVVFVAGAQDTACTLKYSFNGITWFNCKGSYGITNIKIAAWSGKRFVAVQAVTSAGFNIFYSSDGITWSASTQSIISGAALIWTGSQFILGTSKSTAEATNYVSADGVTWTEQTPSPLYDTSLIMNSLAYSSNTVPDLKVANTNFFSKQPQLLGNSSNTNTIMSLSNGLAINNLYSETSGRVGINNNNPASALDVYGDVNFTGTLKSNGNPVNFTPAGINSSGNVAFVTLPSQLYNTTLGGTTAAIKDTTFFGATTISGSLSSTPAIFVGSGASGPFTPGLGRNAILDWAYGCAVGQDGTIYVLNNSGQNGASAKPSICKITPNGAVTLLAGSLTQGYTDGTGSAASFNGPYAATLGLDGSLYVTDNLRIRRVTPSGVVTTVFTNTNIIGGICIDVSGNIYFTEAFAGFTIKRIAAGSTVATVFVGSGTQDQVDGTGLSASFFAPRGLAIDLQGTMYLGDYSSVRKITPAGVVTTLAGNTISTGQTLLTLQTNTLDTSANPQTVTVNGSISHGSIGNNFVVVNNPDGTITLVNRNTGAYFNNAASPWGNYISVPFTGGATFTISYWFYANDTGYYNPWGLSSTATGSEYGINPDLTTSGTIQKFNLRFTGGIVTPQFTVAITTWTHVVLTVNTITGEGKAYKNGVLQSTVTGTGSFINASYLLLGRAGDGFRGFNGYLRNFYVFNTILSQTNITSLANDRTVTVTNVVGNSDGQGREAGFNLINGVTCDIQGNVYVVDSNNYKIKKITPTGLVTTIVNGLNGTRLVDVKFDLAGNLFYTDAMAGYLYKLPNVQRLSTNPSIQVPGTTVTLFAGSGAAGSTDGLGAAATFYNPHGIYPAPDGFIYVIDYGNHKIRRIDASGNVTTFAGTGVGSFANGARLSAQFNRPQDCVMDPSGNLYVVDTVNVRIRKIDASGNVTTFAGSGSTGDADGIGAAASFREPSGITIGGGNLYVTDFQGNRIRKIVISTAAVTTLAGSSSGVSGLIDGIGGQTRFYYPAQIAYGPDGFLYVATINAVRKVSMTGVVTTLAGSSTAGYLDGLGTAAQFNRPYGLAIDALGNVFVSETTNKTIRKITPAGLVTTFLKTTYETMYRIAIDSGNLYISEFNNNKIYKLPGVDYLDPTVSIPTMSASTITSSALTIQNGITLATTNPANLANIQVPGTTPTVLAGSGAAGSADGLGTAATFNVPYGVYAAPNGFIYVCDYSNHCIRRIDASGNVTRIAGLAGTSGSADGNGTTARFNFPEDCVMDSNGNLYIVDTGNQTIRKIDLAGNVSTFAGQVGVSGGTNGTGTAATFNGPTSITIAGDSLYVSEYFPGRIRRIVIATQVVTTLAGDGIGGLADATGTAASFSSAAQITYGADGFLYLANTNAIRRISLSGVVTTFVGGWAAAYLDGVGRAAQINAPQSVAFDSLRNLYVAELNTGRIRKVSPEGVVTTFYTGTFTQIYRISVDSGNNLYVADSGNNKIYKFAAVPYLDPTVTIPVAAASTITTNTFNIKNGNNTLATTSVISGNIPSNYPITFAGSGAAGSADGTGLAATFQSIHGVRAAPDGTIYVFENVTPGRIRRITQDGVVTTLTSSLTGGTQSGDIDAEGNVYCQDGNAISKVTPAGVITLVAGDRATAGFTNGTGAAARLRPRSIALGADGHLYVADSTNNCIRKVELPTGVVTTFAGDASGGSGFVNGQGTAARFSNCDSIVSGVDGNLYMVDRLDGATGNSSLRKITLGGLVTTVAGSSTLGYADAVGTQARFRNPISLSIDPLGNFYLVDQLSYMRKITPSGEVSRFYTGFTRVYHACVDKYGNLFIGEYDQHVVKKFPAVAYYDATMSIAKTSSSTITANTITNSNLYLTETATTKIDIARQKIPMLVAIGGNDNSKPERMIQYSTDDGLTWKNAISGGFKQQGMSGVLYNGSMWVAVGQNGGAGNIQWSMDGINWNYALSESNSSFAIAVGWNGKMWLVSNQLGVNSSSALNTYFLQYSYDGKNWSRINGFTNQFRTNSFAWSDNLGLWVAVGESGYGTLTTLQWSTDGFTWNNATSGGFAGAMPGAGNTGGFGVAWCGGSAGSIGYFIAVGAGSTVANTILKSTDGKNWTNSTSGGFGIQGAKVAWCPYLISGGAGIWIAVGNNNSTTGQVKYSTNGLTWSDIGPVWTANSSAQSIVWTGTSFVAGGDNQAGQTIQLSKNGSSWYPAKSNFLWNCSAIGVGYGSETINTVATVGNTRLLGNLFVGSSNVESPGSVVTTYAGSGTLGNTNGTGTAATFQNISCVCSDTRGRIYVYEKLDGTTLSIRRIENGVVTTLFTLASQDTGWYAMSVALTGTVFYTRGPTSGLNTVVSRKITSDNGVTYGAEADILTGRTDVTAMVQSIKNINLLYYVDQYAILTFDGTTSTVIAGSIGNIGNTDSINGLTARFKRICSICIDSTETYMYILDQGNHSIRRMTLMDPYEVITYAGTGTAGFTDGFRLDARFNLPLGMSLDSNNNIYVGDNENHRVRLVDTSTGMVYTAAGRTGGTTNGSGEVAQFWYPRGLTVSTDGYIYVGTVNGSSHNHVRRMSPFYPNITAINGTVNINTAPDFRYALSVKGNINTNGGSISFIKDQSDNLDGAPMDGIGYYNTKLPGSPGFPLKFGGFYGTVISSGNEGGVPYPYTMVIRQGNVGIDTKQPAYKLDVNGDMFALTHLVNGGNMTGRMGGVYNYRNQAESSIYQSINWKPTPGNGNTYDNTSQGACGIICSAFTTNASIRFYVSNTPASVTPFEAMTINGDGSTSVYGGFHSLRGISCAGNVAVCGNGSSSSFTCGAAGGNTVTTFYTEIMYVGRWDGPKLSDSSTYEPRATEIRSGVSVFNGGPNTYVSGANLSLGGQNLHWVNGLAESARILIDGGRAESGSARDNKIQFFTGGQVRCVMSAGGLYLGGLSGTTQSNLIRFSGTYGDGAGGGYNHTVIGEYKYADNEASELILFKGNDGDNGAGRDRVRVLSSGGFQVDVCGTVGWSDGVAAPAASIAAALCVAPTGYVGIGTTTPDCSLHITTKPDISITSGYQMTNFNVQSWGAANQTTSIKAAGTIWSEIRFIATSDERIKTNIKPVTDSLDIVNKLNIVSFDHIDFWKGSVKHGLIAQEVQKVYPDAVSIQRDYIPSVFNVGTYTKADNVKITSPVKHGFIVNDKIKLYINQDNNPDTRDFEYNTEVLEVISETEFVVKPWENFQEGKDLLIYGKEVDDCLGVDKPLIGVLAAGACKVLSEKVTSLQATVDAQAAEISSLKATVAAILEKISSNS